MDVATFGTNYITKTAVTKFIGSNRGFFDGARSLGDYLTWTGPTVAPTIYNSQGTGSNDTIGNVTITNTSMSAPGYDQANAAAAGAVYTINYTPNATGTLKLTLYLMVDVDGGGGNSNRASTQVAVTDDVTQAVKFRTYNSAEVDNFTLEYSGADQYAFVSAQMNSKDNWEEKKDVALTLNYTRGETNIYYLYVAFTRGGMPGIDGADVQWAFSIDKAEWTVNTGTVSYGANGADSGTAPADTIITSGAEYTAPSTTGLSKLGYHCTGWSYDPNAATAQYTLGQKFITGTVGELNVDTTDNGTETLYAIWEPNTYTTTANLNGRLFV